MLNEKERVTKEATLPAERGSKFCRLLFPFIPIYSIPFFPRIVTAVCECHPLSIIQVKKVVQGRKSENVCVFREGPHQCSFKNISRTFLFSFQRKI